MELEGMEKNAKSVVSEKNYYSLPRGRVTGEMALWRLYTHSVTSLGGERAQLNTSCKENCKGTPLKVPSENHSLPFFSPFLAWGLGWPPLPTAPQDLGWSWQFHRDKDKDNVETLDCRASFRSSPPDSPCVCLHQGGT